ncbi:MAG: ABC transporter permease [Halanaerobium sp.]|nr:ABC transporter permease [Halanaerobium sp.]
MRSYIIRRLLQMIPILIGISMISFFVMNLAPGDYLTKMRMNPDVSPELIAQLRAQYGLDQPLFVQYFKWLWGAIRLDFGYSFTWKVPVFYIIKTRLWNTFILSVSAMVLAWVVAIPIGIHAAVHKYSWSDKILTIFAFIGLSIPNFFFALLFLVLIARTGFLGLPLGGMTSISYEWMTPWEKMVDLGRHLVGPAITLGTAQMAGLMRQMRGQMMDVLRQDYITTARSKGLKERVVIYKHAVRNAINPLVTMLGFTLAFLLSGAVLTETVFGWPGMGKLMVDAVLNRDVYLAMAGLMMASVLLMLGNLFADILLAVVDPRIRYN